MPRKTSTNRVMSSTGCIRPPTDDHAGVVVLAGQDGRLLRPHQGRADALDLVGRHLLPVAGATDDHPEEKKV